MNRQECIAELAKEFLVERLIKDRMRLATELSIGYPALYDNFKNSIDELMSIARRQQKEENKKEICYIAIAELYSSIITKSYDFLVSFLDENFYLDSIDTSISWSPKSLYQTVDGDLDDFYKYAAPKIVRLKSYELAKIRNAYIKIHNNMAMGLLMKMARPVVIECGLSELKTAAEVKLILGEYMDRGSVFDTIILGDVI